MSEADKMFEELGYKKESEYYYHTTIKHIRFLRHKKEIVVETNLGFSDYINMQELQAINEKVKELGWYE